MIATTFNEDLIGLKDFSKRLWNFIEVEHHFVDGSLVIGLSSKYGSGKSTFLRMWRDDLDKNPPGSCKPLVVPLNAWESDYFGDPLFAIVSALVGSLKEAGGPVNPIIDAAKDVGWFATTIAGQIVNKFTGIDAMAAGDATEKKRAARTEAPPVPTDGFSVYEARKNAMLHLKAQLEKFVNETSLKVLFLVDELDRCRPDYAIAYLETIKHIFDLPGATFVLAADRHHLRNSARTAFGQDLDFEEYYRKFVHREVTLPAISDQSYRAMARAYATHYLEREGLRVCFMPQDRNQFDNFAILAEGLNLTPRQIQEAFRVLGHMMSAEQNKRGQLAWGLAMGSLTMALLKVSRPELYNLLGSQKLDAEVALEFISETMPQERADWWLMLFSTGGGLRLKENETLFEAFKRLGLAEDQNKDAFQRDMQGWGGGWGYLHEARFPLIRGKIDQIMKWA
jgi:hypothetical protein